MRQPIRLEEAGGQVTGLSGGPFHYTQKQIVASNGRLHDRMLSILS